MRELPDDSSKQLDARICTEISSNGINLRHQFTASIYGINFALIRPFRDSVGRCKSRTNLLN
jgi:hypothetical protein